MIRCSIGSPKARVFPDPVSACPQMSRPARASRNRERLDRKWRLNAILLELLNELGIYAEIGKRSGLQTSDSKFLV